MINKLLPKKIKIVSVTGFFLLCLCLIILIAQPGRDRKNTSFNVLMISLDALRPDHLGCYGYKRPTSSNIDRLAEEGVLFTNAVTVSAMTPIVLASLFTSTYPDQHKVYGFGYMLDERLRTLPSILKDKGFLTAGTGGGWLETLSPGLAKDFGTLMPAQQGIEELTRQCLQWIESCQNERFFFWIHFADFPHAPYDPPEPFDKMFTEENTSEKDELLPVVSRPEGFGGIPGYIARQQKTNKNFYISRYDAEIACADHFIGIILQRLKELNIEKKTLIILFSDHGEEMGEHGYYFSHGCSLYEPAIRIPLIFKLDGVFPEGKKIDSQVSLLDIMPTILELTRCPKEKYIQGKSLLSLLKGGKRISGGRVYGYVGDFSAEEFAPGSVTKPKYSLRTNEWKLLFDETGNGVELYDLAEDPGEKNRLSLEDKKVPQALKKKLFSWITRIKKQRCNTRRLSDFKECFKEKMRSLGYLQ